MNNDPQGQNAPQAPQQQQSMAISPEQAQSIANNIPTPEQVKAMQPESKRLEVKFEDDLILYVDSETVNDMRFMELYDLVSENNMKLPKLLRFMFGEKEFDSIYHYYESRGQRFTMTKMESVFEKFNTDMNSNPDFLKQ